MNSDLIHTTLLALLFLTLFAFCELLYHKVKLKAESTRKIVHLGTGLLTLLFPLWINNHWYILALCSSFLVILLLSLKFKLLPSINAVNRTTRGSILYPFVAYGCYLLFQNYDSLVYFYLPILILAICDPIAALVGKKLKLGPYVILGHTKTLIGSFAFFISAFLVTFFCLILLSHLSSNSAIYFSLFIGLTTTIAEAVSQKGYDNFTIPLTASAMLVLLLPV